MWRGKGHPVLGPDTANRRPPPVTTHMDDTCHCRKFLVRIGRNYGFTEYFSKYSPRFDPVLAPPVLQSQRQRGCLSLCVCLRVLERECLCVGERATERVRVREACGRTGHQQCDVNFREIRRDQ